MAIGLLMRGDDAGMSRSANRAIREACEKGICRNISVLAPAPELEDAALCLRDLPDVAFGLHVDLTAEWDVPHWGPLLPAQQVPALLAPGGGFYQVPNPLHDHHAPLEQMMAEIEAQLARLRKAGFRISYMDEHMNVGWVGELAGALADMARREGLVFRPPLLSLPELPAGSGIRPGDHAGHLAAQVRGCPDGDYLVIGHPAYDDEEMRRVCRERNPAGEIARDREQQRLMFTRADVLETVTARGARLLRYDQL